MRRRTQLDRSIDTFERGFVVNGCSTIADIASELGVSVPTISTVLHGRADVSETMRLRVEEAIVRHNNRKPVAYPLCKPEIAPPGSGHPSGP